MFKKKGLAGLGAPSYKAPAAPQVPSMGQVPGASMENPSDEEDGSSQGEHIGMRGGAGAPRRPRGLGRLGPR